MVRYWLGCGHWQREALGPGCGLSDQEPHPRRVTSTAASPYLTTVHTSPGCPPCEHTAASENKAGCSGRPLHPEASQGSGRSAGQAMVPQPEGSEATSGGCRLPRHARLPPRLTAGLGAPTRALRWAREHFLPQKTAHEFGGADSSSGGDQGRLLFSWSPRRETAPTPPPWQHLPPDPASQLHQKRVCPRRGGRSQAPRPETKLLAGTEQSGSIRALSATPSPPPGPPAPAPRARVPGPQARLLAAGPSLPQRPPFPVPTSLRLPRVNPAT